MEHSEFKSCLRALGYDLPMVEEGQEEPEFQAILDSVDPNRDGSVSLQDYMAFMISKETENVQSSEEIENAFRAITADREYVMRAELYDHLTKGKIVYYHVLISRFFFNICTYILSFEFTIILFSRILWKWLIIALEK